MPVRLPEYHISWARRRQTPDQRSRAWRSSCDGAIDQLRHVAAPAYQASLRSAKNREQMQHEFAVAAAMCMAVGRVVGALVTVTDHSVANWRLAHRLAAGPARCPPGDHLVGVHLLCVPLPGLPNDRESGCPTAADYSSAGALDQLRGLIVQLWSSRLVRAAPSLISQSAAHR